jgi:hypothetical protein
MWIDPLGKLDEHLRLSSTLQVESLIVGEWNLNDFVDVKNYGTYRYRPSGAASGQYFNLPLNYDPLDLGDYYTEADQSIYTFGDFVSEADEPVLFESVDVDRELYYSLRDCFKPFRPRSGINKCLYFEDKFIDNIRSGRRPRYYMASRYDNFKYWSSYRRQVQDGEVEERGVSFTSNPAPFTNDIGYMIEDTCPFVVYEKAIPTNRIVMKIQTNLAETSLGNFRTTEGIIIEDPLGNRNTSSIPQRFKIQYLDLDDNWITAGSFDENSARSNGTNIINWDGYLELYYGIKVPDQYRNSFRFVDYLDNINNLPTGFSLVGEAYIVGSSENSPGTLYIWNDSTLDWDESIPEYGFSLSEVDDTQRIGLVKNLVSPPYFNLSGQNVYREFAFIKGLRIVVETMIAPDKTFELIELSPRLRTDLSNHVESFSVTKAIANDSTGLPVGSLIATVGGMNIFNHDGAFTKEFYDPNSETGLFSDNTGSIVSQYMKPNVKFDLYETILNVDGYDKYIPIKTMYAENFPGTAGAASQISINLRDNFFRVEMTRAPSIFLTNATLTSVVSMLLDNIGFSNYVFKGFDDVVRQDVPESELEYFASIYDPVIPYFFVEPDISVAEALNNIAMSTQTAMFFDEYNNFVVMPKEYLLPDENGRQTNLTLYGQEKRSGSTLTALPNIANASVDDTRVLNDGVITYSIRYIQRSYSSLSQAQFLDEDKTFVYKPVLLWEVANSNASRSKFESENTTSGGYALAAAPLNTSLTAAAPFVVDNQIDPATNIIDLGENVYWLGRFQGYLYANGEIIRYDAIEYDVSGSGRVWITSNQQYQNYFSSLPFNGKIYPTGNVRIFVEPYYVEYENAPQTEDLETNVTYKNGPVKRHGRGQFGTEIVEHSAGLPEYWSDDTNVRGCKMDSQFIFSTTPTEQISYPASSPLGSPVGVNNTLAQESTRNGVIKNFMRRVVPSDDEVRTLRVTSSGTIQSSALVFTGPQNFPSDVSPRDFISYVYKPLDNAFRHFGTRMRIIGKLETNDRIQSPNNASPYFNIQPNNTSDTVNINGGSGGIGVGVNPTTNYGYFFEICALTADNLSRYITTNKETGQQETVLHNVIFYKVIPSSGGAQARKLWGGLSQIIVDDGRFTGQDRLANEKYPTVYDLAVEYENIGSTRRFYLYINGSQVAFVDDADPLPEYSNLCLFTRGSAEMMFENVYALQNLMSKNTGETAINQVADSFGVDEISTSQALRKYAVSGFVRSTYLTGISPQHSPRFSIYFEEFGTIMRECAYFNIRYDQAYPALIAQIAPTFNKERGYSVSGFYAGSYGAEFLVFNTTDKTIALDESTGNYLRILGVTFTQNTTEELTVDDFFKERTSFSDPFRVESEIRSPIVADKIYQDIVSSRNKFGRKEFNLQTNYIQNTDDARDLMKWIVEKTLKVRKIVQIEVFGTPQLQLGDIVAIDYDLPEGVPLIEKDKQLVVAEISYEKSLNGISNIIRLVEI